MADVSVGSPADKAGFKSGDVIREYNGQTIKDATQLKLQVAQTAPGTKVPGGAGARRSDLRRST